MTDREQFEAWARSVGWPHYATMPVTKGPDFFSDLSWDVWQAARAQSSTSNQVEVGTTVQAGQVLITDEEIDAAYEKAKHDYQRSRFAVRGQQLTAQDSPDWWFARAIEQAVLAKRVPQWLPIETAPKDGTRVMVWMNDQYASNQHAFAKLWFYQDGKLGGGAEGYSGNWSISHWMPLPPPPGIGGEKGGA